MGRHKISNTRKAWRARAQRLADDLERSEEAREGLLRARNDLLDQVRRLSAQLVTLQTELGTECPTMPVQIIPTGGPVYALRPPQTGSIPLQGPGGERLAAPVHGIVSRPSPGRTTTHRPRWAVG